ncbi:MAG: GntR family transcriptional regulator [Sedimentibacter sp.]
MFDLAYESIRSMITEKKILPRQQIVEEDIASMFGISRTPVREAMRRLQEEGIIERIANKGSFLKAISSEELANGYEVIEALQAMATKILTEQFLDKTIDVSAFEKLKDYADLIEKSYKENNLQQYIMYDSEFHKQIIKMTNNPIMIKTYENMMYFAHQVYMFITPTIVDKKITTEQHFLILDSISKGNTIDSMMISHDHIDRVVKQIYKLL